MDTWHEDDNLPNLHHYLKKLDAYTLRCYKRTRDSVFNIERPSAYVCQECFGPHDIEDCTKVKKAEQALDSNMLSNHSNKGRNNMKGCRGKGNNRKTGQRYQGYQAGPPIHPYKPYQLHSKETNFKRPYPNKFQLHFNKQPWKKKTNFANLKNWARGSKTSDQGARSNYKGKAEKFDPDYHKRFQANHVIGQQQHQFAIMPHPYMYQANAALPPLAPRVHFNQNQSVSDPFALNTEIVQPQDKPIFSQDGRFNASTETRRFAKFSETINGNKVDCVCIFSQQRNLHET